MTNRWWVIQETELHAALMRAHHGDDADMVLLELTANTATEHVEGDDAALDEFE